MVQVTQAVAASPGYNGPFQGNPNPSIASITVGITCSRTSGTTPMFYHCSASPTTATCTGTINCSSGTETKPYEDIEFAWDNGDPTGGETFTQPISLATVNANHQFGPEDAYVLRAAKTTTVTLYARACTNGRPATAYTGGGGTCAGGAYTLGSAQVSITATTFTPANTYWFAQSGSGSVCSQVAPCSNVAGLITTTSGGLIANNTLFHLNCGDTFAQSPVTNATGVINIANSGALSGIHIDQGGTNCPGPAPIVEVNGGTNVAALYIVADVSGSSLARSDVVVSGISFTDGGSATIGTTGGVCDLGGSTTGQSSSFQDIYLDFRAAGGCSDTLGAGGIEDVNTQAGALGTFRNVGIWGGTFSSPLSGTNCIGILSVVQQWQFVYGTTVSGNGTNNAQKCHHIYLHTQLHLLTRWNLGGASCTGASCTYTRSYSIKNSFDCTNCTGGITGGSDDGVPGYVCSGACIAQYYLNAENHFKGTWYGRDLSNNNNDPTATRIQNAVDQQNEYDNLPGQGLTSGGSGENEPDAGQTWTIRDTWTCNMGDQWFTPNGITSGGVTYLHAQLYRNLIYQNTGPTGNFAGSIIYGTPVAISWGGGSPLTQIIDDNIIEDTGSTSSILVSYIKSTDWVTAGSIFDYDTYYVPNAGANDYLSNNGTGVTFSAWQALGSGWDSHGNAVVGTNSNWPSPGTCGFGSWPYSW